MALSRALSDQSLAVFLDRRVQPEMFADAESAGVYKYLLDFHKQYRKVPSPQTVQAQFPGYQFGYAAEPVEVYVDAMVEQFVRNRAFEVVEQHITRLDLGNPLDVATSLGQQLVRLSALGTRHIERLITDNISQRLDAYRQRKAKVGLLGIPTPWPSLDDMTQGWQKEMYVGVMARPKTGKTWFMLRLAYAAWRAGYRVMFVNKELPDEMMDRRFDALHAKLPYERFRTGDLTDVEEQRYEKAMADLDAAFAAGAVPDFRWVHGVSTVSGIDAKVEEFKPDILFIDGAYLLIDEEKARQAWEQQQNLSRGFKRIAQVQKVPTIISIQAGRGADQKKSKTQMTMSDARGSDAFAQDVDILIGLEQSDDDRVNNVLNLLPLAVREARPEPIRVGWDFDTMESKDLGVGTVIIEDDDALQYA
jgi:replicative DNA helicase